MHLGIALHSSMLYHIPAFLIISVSFSSTISTKSFLINQIVTCSSISSQQRPVAR